MTDDAQLLTRYVRDRDERAFAELVRRHIDGVYSAALRRVGGDAHLAEDVTQQVFVAVARNARRLAQHAAPIAWFYATTRNVAANVVRGERRRKAREEAPAMNETENVDWSRTALVLDAAIDELGEGERTVVLLRFVERRAFAEIGARLNVSEDAARMRLERALEKLRMRLARRGVTSSQAALSLALSTHATAAAPVGLTASVTSAVASVGAGGGFALGLMTVLLHSKWVPAVTTLVALVAVGVAEREARAERGAEARLVAAEAWQADLRARLRETERRATEVEDAARAATAREKASAAKRSLATAGSGATETAVELREPVAVAEAMMERHPAIREALLDWHGAKVRFQFAPLIRSLGLTPEQTERFVALVRGEILFGDYGPNGQFAEFRLARELEGAERWSELRALLGEAGFKQYWSCVDLIAAREYTAQLASQLSWSDAPLSLEQADSVLPLFRKLRTVGGDDEERVRVWDALLNEAGAHLLPPQLEALRRIATLELKAAAVHRVQLAVVQAANETKP